MAENLVLGRGKLYFTPYLRNATTGGEKGFFGNAPTLTLAQNTTQLDHYSSTGGLKIKDKSIVLQEDMTLTFDLDNISLANLILWFGGSNIGALPADAPSDIGDLKMIGIGSAIYGALTYEEDNPVGDNISYWWPYVNLRPSGNFALIADTWQTMSFTAEALKRDKTTERLYVFALDTGESAAATDDTDYITEEGASYPNAVAVTAGTVTAPGTGTVDTPFNVTWTMTAPADQPLYGWLAAHNGTSPILPAKAIQGASGTTSMTVHTAHSDTIKLYDTADCTNTAIATSGTIVIS